MSKTRLTYNQRFVIAVLIQLAIILAIVLPKLILATKTTIYLRAELVDPRSPLRGDYLVLEYPNLSKLSETYYISKPTKETIVDTRQKTLDLKRKDTVYTRLIKVGGEWQAAAFTKEKPDPNEFVFIKGIIKDITINQITKDYQEYIYHIEYGIENYFIPENSGEKYSTNPNKYLLAEITVDENGNSLLKNIKIINVKK
ncbi:MAG: hypothetical protein KatS3mg091_235 [Patescibacteria group bacterium]|nr:MAG: hypothetical protein KatS3mg091_235 [Patescibacteria group bacterium]